MLHPPFTSGQAPHPIHSPTFFLYFCQNPFTIKRNLLYNSILTVSQILFPVITIPYITRVLDPEGLGRVSFIDAFTYYFVVIAEAGVVTYGIREVARRKDDAVAMKNLVSDLLSLHIRTSLAAIVLYGAFVIFAYQRVNDPRLIWFSLSFLIVNAFSCEWYFWGKERFGYIALRSLIVRLLGLASIFILLQAPEDYFIYYAIIVLSAIATVVWNLIVLRKEVPFGLKGSGWRRHFSATMVMYGISLTYSVMLMLDSVILGFAVSATAVSFYALASRIVRMGTNLITDPLLVFYPNLVSRLSRGEENEFRRVVSISFQWVLLLTIPLAAGVWLLADSFTSLYLGDAFFPVSNCLKILAFYPLIKAIGLFLNKQVLLPFDKERLVLRSLLITVAIFVPLAFTLSYFYSFEGACVAIIIAEAITTALNFYYVQKLGKGINVFDPRTILHAITGTLFFIPLVLTLRTTGLELLPTVLLSAFGCIAIYTAWLLAVRNKPALELARNIREFVSGRGTSR